MNRSPVTRWRWWTWAAISIHFLVILWLGLSRHWGYMSSLNDLGVFDQAAWGTLHGQFLLNTSQFNQPINWLGFHFHPLILLFVPLYAIAPYPEWFTLAQALALSIAAWPIFLLASRVCQSETAGLLWAIAYLVNPFLLNAAAWDFHPVTLAVPFMALGLLAVEKADSRLLLLSCLPLLLIQEQLGLTVATFGALWGLRNQHWKTAVSLILLGTAHTALVLGMIMPAFSPTGSHVMLGRYGWLGKSIGDIALNLLLHPWAVAQKVLFGWGGWLYPTLLLLPLLGFPLAAPVYLLPALPDLAANLLSANRMPSSVFAYHSVTLVPVFTIAAAYGARRISQWWTWLSSAQISGLALLASLVLGYALAPLPMPGAVNFWAPARFPIAPDPTLPAVHASVGDSASVSAQSNIGAHFSQRSQIYAYPQKLDDVEAVVLRLESPTKKLLPKESISTASLASHLQMRPADYLASIECLLADKRYGVKLWKDPWLVFAKGARKGETERKVETRLMRLREQWGLGPKEEARTPAECEG
ncbi:MAG: DUF2079 domain-containing protein [Nitrosomonadales bacterium]|nr:DUF2079 domain-containing protein [Nitrosomonadales bacterium]